MKIHLPNHNIKERGHVRGTDIPLAYIDTKDSTYKADFIISKDFAEDSSRVVRPYDELPRSDTMLFDSNGKPVNAEIKREGNKYYYDPGVATEFTPMSFSCQAHIQRHLNFSGSKFYNLRIAAVETSANDLYLSSRLINIFGDAYKRGVCPPNVTVNNGSMTAQSLIEASASVFDQSSARTDFLFIESNDGTYLGSLTIEQLMKNHINVWISASSFGGMITPVASFNLSSAKKEGCMGNVFKKTARKKAPSYAFDTRKRNPSFSESVWEYSFPYEDVLVLHKNGEGYVVVTPTTFIDHIGDFSKIAYDVLINIFLKGYQGSRSMTSWITDEPVDYMALSQEPLNKYHKTINLDKMLSTQDFDMSSDEYSILKINVTNDVALVSKDDMSNLYFRKFGTGNKDPEKTATSQTFLTTRNTVIVYRQEDINFLTARPRLLYKNVNGGISIIVEPMSDSARLLYTSEPQELPVPNPNLAWYVCAKAGYASGVSPFSIVEASVYNMASDGWILAEVRIRKEYSVNVVDARVPGGGLPSGEPDDYDLIDIGNVYGRPYRIGSSTIIRLPKRLEPYKEIIENAVMQHIQAGDYPVLLFK